jgi:hypothetical protein
MSPAPPWTAATNASAPRALKASSTRQLCAASPPLLLAPGLCLLTLLLTPLPLLLFLLLSRQPLRLRLRLLPGLLRLLCLLLQPRSNPAFLGGELLPLPLCRALPLQLSLLTRGVHLSE